MAKLVQKQTIWNMTKKQKNNKQTNKGIHTYKTNKTNKQTNTHTHKQTIKTNRQNKIRQNNTTIKLKQKRTAYLVLFLGIFILVT